MLCLVHILVQNIVPARIDPTLADLRTHDISPPPFLTLIVGSPAHPLAGKALHSHLVGCYTNNDTRYHFTLFVPVGPDHCLPVPLEWAPLFVALATICLYPSLPFLVCAQDYTLGTFSDMDDLTGLGSGKRENKQTVPWRDGQKCRMYGAEDSQKITRPDREI